MGELEGGGRIRALAVEWLQLRLGIILVHMRGVRFVESVEQWPSILGI